MDRHEATSLALLPLFPIVIVFSIQIDSNRSSHFQTRFKQFLTCDTIVVLATRNPIVVVEAHLQKFLSVCSKEPNEGKCRQLRVRGKSWWGLLRNYLTHHQQFYMQANQKLQHTPDSFGSCRCRKRTREQSALQSLSQAHSFCGPSY